MTLETLTICAATVLSLAFSYIPGLSAWFAAQDGIYKRLIMLGLLTGVSLIAFGIACGGLGPDFGLTVTCDKTGAIELFKTLILAIIANQSVYAITPQTKAVRAVQAAREGKADSSFGRE